MLEMIRRLTLVLTAATLSGGIACARTETTAPARVATSGANADKGNVPPGSVGAPHIIMNGGGMIGCTPRDPQYGRATIGPSGGELDVGPHRLIIPPGALQQTVEVSGTIVEDSPNPRIDLEPHGLQFNKPAGLILDASNCTDVPDIVYINEVGVVSDPILAVYSNWWHTIAAPINHFSGYMVAF
jgi:hypothetical protein